MSVSNRTVRVSPNLSSFMDGCHKDWFVLFTAPKNILVFSFEKVHRVESSSNRTLLVSIAYKPGLCQISQSLNPFPRIKPSRSTRRPLYTHLPSFLLSQKVPNSPP